MTTDHLHLAVALDGAGWHPYAWKDAGVRPAQLFSAEYWVQQAQLAERGLLDFITLEDAFGPRITSAFGVETRTDHVTGRLDAVELAARIAPETDHIGIVATTDTLQTEPFHLASALSTLDYASHGRAGWRVRAGGVGESGNFGRRADPELSLELLQSQAGHDLIEANFDEAADVVEAVRRLWDSWEDDAIIRDLPTGRFLDREKVHHVHYRSDRFSVAGPSITPRPPQGQVLVTALAHATVPYRLAARAADVVFITPADATDARRIVDTIRELERQVDRSRSPLRIFADVVVALDDSAAAAASRLERWNDLDRAQYVSDALIVADSVTGLADRLLEWRGAGIEGFRLRPASVARDLPAIVDLLVPELQARDAFRRSYEATPEQQSTLRGRLGLDRPANRYATLTKEH